MNKAKALSSAALTLVAAAWLSCTSDHAPDVPAVPTGPAFCFKDTTYTFQTVVSDPDGDSVAVRFDWGDSTLSAWSDFFASGETIELTHAWSDTGTYMVRAWAQDQEYVASDFSDGLSVMVVLSPDAPSEPAGPDQGAQDSSYTFTSFAFNPESTMVAIRFAWGDGDTSDWSSFVASGESVGMSHVWPDTGTYRVRAQARDTGTGRSQWSPTHDIFIHPPDTLLKWRLRLDAGKNLSPAIGPDGTIYVAAADSSLYAVSPDGTLKWRYQTGRYVQSSPALAADGTVYFWADDNWFYAVDSGGALKWRYQLIWSVTSCPAVAADGTIYVGSYGSYLRALDPDGTLKWFILANGVIASSPAVAADGTIYFGAVGLYALNPDSTLKWRYTSTGNVPSSPAIAADGTICFGSTDHYVYAMNPDGTLKWKYETGGNIESSPVIAPDGTVYIGSIDNHLYALNPDGTLKWKYATQQPVRATPVVAADGVVCFGSDDNALYALYPDGSLKWRYETGDNVAAGATIGTDGTIIFVSHDGYLYALKGTSPLADTPWPKFHHDLRNTGRVGGGR